jgi:hypothetical protein
MTSATHTRRPTPAGTPDEQLLFPMSFRDEGELRAYEVHEVRAHLQNAGWIPRPDKARPVSGVLGLRAGQYARRLLRTGHR